MVGTRHDHEWPIAELLGDVRSEPPYVLVQ
jgi:hypothetical protein